MAEHMGHIPSQELKYLSVCSGIEAATVAWHHMGWEPVAFSEIEPFPCALLAHHYPDTPNWGDMTKFQEWPNVPIDLLCGGFPCQPHSLAGKRLASEDERRETGERGLHLGEDVNGKSRLRQVVVEVAVLTIGQDVAQHPQ